jgi:hypothetical protein
VEIEAAWDFNKTKIERSPLLPDLPGVGLLTFIVQVFYPRFTSIVPQSGLFLFLIDDCAA